MRALILSVTCVAGLALTASQASAGEFDIGIGVYRPAPVVVVRPMPTYYPPIYQPYYYPPAIVQTAPIYVAPRPVYYPNWSPPHHHNHGHNHWGR